MQLSAVASLTDNVYDDDARNGASDECGQHEYGSDQKTKEAMVCAPEIDEPIDHAREHFGTSVDVVVDLGCTQRLWVNGRPT